jgi:hypothetical protein
MWTIGVVVGLRFPGFPNELGKRGNAGLRPHTSQRNDRNRSIGADIETGAATP